MPPQRDSDVLSVSALTAQIKRLLEGQFPMLWVGGEIASLTRAGSGHMYFSLKDANSQLRAVMYRGSNLRLHLGPSDAGRLMRNRTPSPGPVRLSVHDWYRRKHFGASKRIRNMNDAERTRAHGILEEARLGKKV